jgi:hypothetical protein
MTGITARVGERAAASDYSCVFLSYQPAFGALIRFLRESTCPLLRFRRIALSGSCVALLFSCYLSAFFTIFSRLAETD